MIPNAHSCLLENVTGMPFCDPSREIPDRVQDLLARLTVDEKIGMMGSSPGTDICNIVGSGVPRLGVAPMAMLVEANSGISSSCYIDDSGVSHCPTIFPAPLLLAASFNRSLWRAKGNVVGVEARAFNNLNVSRIYDAASKVDLNAFGPDINLILDPRNGRNGELASEDPFLSGQYAVEYVRGAQEGEDPRYTQLIMGLKHYSFYQSETNRFGFIGNVTAFDIWDSYLPPFQAGFVEGRAAGAMCSYTSVTGLGPSCASAYLLTQVAREYWNQTDALITSDCGAVANQWEHNGYAPNATVAAAQSLLAGTDVNDGSDFNGDGGLTGALAEGLITESDLDAALGRNLAKRMAAGMFDPLDEQVYTTYGAERIHSVAHADLAREAALQGLVLLKNGGGASSTGRLGASPVLPLDAASLSSIAVVGPHAVSRRPLLGDYYEDAFCPGITNRSVRADQCVPTIGASIAQAVSVANPNTILTVVEGTDVASGDTAGIPAAVLAASSADVVIIAVGYDNAHIEHEGADHPNVTLPGAQPQLVEALLAQAAKTGAATVMVLINAGAIAIGDYVDRVDAVVEAFYPSLEAQAVADHLFGAANRFGRLPYTIYPESFISQVALQDLSVARVGRTYRYYNNTPLFAFGDGLSYTTFATTCTGSSTAGTTEAVAEEIGPAGASVPLRRAQALDVWQSSEVAPSASISCSSKAVGGMSGDQILLVFHRVGPDVVAKVNGAHPIPSKSLVDFDRLPTSAVGEQASVSFQLDVSAFALTAQDGSSMLYPGTHYFDVSPRQPETVAFTLTVMVPGVAPVVVAKPPVAPVPE